MEILKKEESANRVFLDWFCFEPTERLLLSAAATTDRSKRVEFLFFGPMIIRFFGIISAGLAVLFYCSGKWQAPLKSEIGWIDSTLMSLSSLL